jgi:hypothetical protein
MRWTKLAAMTVGAAVAVIGAASWAITRVMENDKAPRRPH